MEPVPAPVHLPSALNTIVSLINDLQRKNKTMIDYYIHPSPIPTEIAAFEPRLLIYRTRVQNLARLSLTHLPFLIDDAVPLVASFAIPNVSQLATASANIQTLFIEHYDRRLEQSRPYDTIQETLRFYEHSLHQFMGMQMRSPRQPAESFVPPPSSISPSLCRGATAFLNNRDHGKVSSVAPEDLLPPHRGRLADRGGVVLWWECPLCAFKLRYHASNSALLSINQTDEILIEDDVEKIAYRSAWLAKCHIYHPRQPVPAAPSPPTSPRIREREPERELQRERVIETELYPTRSSISQPQTRPQAPPKRVSFTRRKSSGTSVVTLRTTTTTTRVAPTTQYSPTSPVLQTPLTPNSQSPTSPSLSRPKHKRKPKAPPQPTGPNGLVYYCPFCVAQGKPLIGPPADSSFDSSSSSSDDDHRRRNPEPEPTCFENSKELIEHIDDRHSLDRPVNLLLQALKVAVDGKMAAAVEARGGGRWDLEFRH